jgi:cation:H+ antiporter
MTVILLKTNVTILTTTMLFVFAGSLLYAAGELLVSGLSRLSRYFRIDEFVVAFIVMAFAATVPNFFVGITSALQGVPELSYGDVMGNNVVALTLAVALAVIFSPKKEIPLESRTVRDSALLTPIAALLPLVLIVDGMLSRTDGIVLILFFAIYVIWLFSRKEHFSKVYDLRLTSLPADDKKSALVSMIKVVVGIVMLAVAAQLVVHASVLIAHLLSIPLMVIGVLVVGLGGALPELYFTFVSARKGETSMLLGNLMGAVIIPATLVLGIVALIHPIQNENLELPLVGRIFLATIALLFLYFSRTQQSISKNEGYFLLFAYTAFVAMLLLL